MTTTRKAALALALGLAVEPAVAATCRMTVQGAPVIDDQECSVAGRRGEVLVTDAAGDAIRIRRSTLSARFIVGGRRLGPLVSYGGVVASVDSGDRSCYFGQKAVLCIEP